MKKHLTYSLASLLFGFLAFSCTPDEAELVEPSMDNKAALSLSCPAGATCVPVGNGQYQLSNAIYEGLNTWSFTIKQTGDPKGIGLSNLVIGYTLCPDEELPAGGILLESAAIINGSSQQTPVIEYSIGLGTGCAFTGSNDGYFKLDELTALSKDKLYTVRFTIESALPVRIDYFEVLVKAGNNCVSAVLDAGDCTPPPTDDCSYSQGYFFAKPGPTWGGLSVSLGGETYNEADGRYIWSTSNAGGIATSKKVFLQAATIMLSYQLGHMSSAVYGTLSADIAIISNYLAQFDKLTSYEQLPSGGDGAAAAWAAAARLDQFIQANHCDNR
ncbi:hypothetical protein [Cesiribacter andamanensis]|uniref:Uncharacterized protein n=1 Tax=Cesiribacter andamanensis AMV16 TaxID=1279009 RepID=M7NQV1_9BACT|nr:hypothetical protein [Cesiribacter andamanensis]EMR04095.1 hypothetical protein ADICEAN_00718 [Cesiribacter andamanensis AMV16]